MDIATWLTALDLGRYTQAFRDNDINRKVLEELTDAELRELGVSSLGHRKKLLAAIAALHEATAQTETGAKQGAVPPRLSTSGERRQLTVMFCDLVGYTALASRLDPEDLREVLGAYHRRVAKVVSRSEGFIAKYMGDGVLAYFGYPQAHEDDAERAAGAGLKLAETIHRVPTHADVKLQVRVGIASGLVVVGDIVGSGAAQEHTVVGETPNLAARLQAIAQPNAVVIAASTRQLLGNTFEYRDLGAVEARGFAGSVQAWQVLRASTTDSRFEAFHSADALVPLIGRQEDIALLMRCWQQAKSSKGQVVLISGEAGIGKSRILAALEEMLQVEPYMRLRYFCSLRHQGSALHPTIAQLGRSAGFERKDVPETRLDKLEALLKPAAQLKQDAGLLAELLSIPGGDRYPALSFSPLRRKKKTFDVLVRQMRILARQRPLLVIYEDVHWIDPTSRELLNLVIERLQHLRVLLVVTFRPEFQPPWSGGHITALVLNRLGRQEGAALVRQIAVRRSDALTPEIVNEIVERASGVPLFVEELTKAVLEARMGRPDGAQDAIEAVTPPTLPVPVTLHASLMARLDHLGPAAREVAQVGSAVGRQFAYELLAAVVHRSHTELRAALIRLTDAGLIFCEGSLPQATFLFKHSLVQDAAYGTLLRGRRQELHARLAEALRAHVPNIEQMQPEVLAHHYTEAGLLQVAAEFWQKAGERALRQSANIEAVQHLRRGVDLARSLPPSADRSHRELALLLALGPATRAVKGHGAPEALEAFAGAQALLDEGSTVAERMIVLYGLWGVRFVRGQYSLARELAGQCLELSARHADDGEAAALANNLMGVTLWAMAEFEEAQHHLARSFAASTAMENVTDLRFSHDHCVAALSYTAWVLWPLGYPDQASARAAEAVVRSHAIGHAVTTALALLARLLLAELSGDTEAAEACAEEEIAHCDEHGVTLHLAWARFSQGLARCRHGDYARGIDAMRRAMADAASMHSAFLRELQLGRLGEAYGAFGQAKAGLSLIEEAIALTQSTGGRMFEAELHRLQGDLLLAQNRTEEAEASFKASLVIARRQGAKSWELRAARDYARLLMTQGKLQEAKGTLQPVYDGFTEGFDAPDLIRAKALLDELKAAEGP